MRCRECPFLPGPKCAHDVWESTGVGKLILGAIEDIVRKGETWRCHKAKRECGGALALREREGIPA